MTHKGADVFFDLPFPVDYAKEKLEPLGLGNVAKKLEELRTEKRRHKKDSHHWRLPYPTVSDAILLIGEEINVDGFIGPANKLDVLKDYRQLSQWKKVFCPGVGRQSTEPEEQQLKNIYEVLGIRSAAIIGSTIYKAADPAAAAAGYRKMRDPIVEHIEAMREC
jgi:hypothetical protein